MTTQMTHTRALADGTLIAAAHITKMFPLPDGHGVFTVLDDVSLEERAGEVVALLGRSGSGKNTLPRIVAGLIPASGAVTSQGVSPRGANPDVAMVFQSFAQLPWLTVQDNVEVWLKARGVSRTERRERALQAIDLVGLDGFESAYPKEISGGMTQRVGFARAFVVQPQVLFMDEPFSALDVLTAENLRGKIGDLWEAGTFPARRILIVTHNSEEAVTLADRVVIRGAKPWPRARGDTDRPAARARRGALQRVGGPHLHRDDQPRGGRGHIDVGPHGRVAAEPRLPPLPHARAAVISGLLEVLVDRGGPTTSTSSRRDC